jgi:hypothetical protein
MFTVITFRRVAALTDQSSLAGDISSYREITEQLLHSRNAALIGLLTDTSYVFESYLIITA